MGNMEIWGKWGKKGAGGGGSRGGGGTPLPPAVYGRSNTSLGGACDGQTLCPRDGGRGAGHVQGEIEEALASSARGETGRILCAATHRSGAPLPFCGGPYEAHGTGHRLYWAQPSWTPPPVQWNSKPPRLAGSLYGWGQCNMRNTRSSPRRSRDMDSASPAAAAAQQRGQDPGPVVRM